MNQLDLVDFLSSLGIDAVKIRGNSYWYFSPFRNEKTPSFKVNRKLNRWYDFGEAKGSSVVDFGIRYFNCSVSDLLRKFSTGELLQNVAHKPASEVDAGDDHIEIKNISVISSPSLLHYLEERRIPLNVAHKFCSEVHFGVGKKNYFAVGFQNDLGGFELRNKYFKGSSSPKGTTLFHNTDSRKINVFEGSFDFLSYQVLMENQAGWSNYLVLNSLSFFEKALPVMEQFDHVNLFLNNDAAGNRVTDFAIKNGPKYRDERKLFADYKDVNDLLCGIRLKPVNNISLHPGRRS